VSEQERYQRPPLRYRRFGGGYRREDVEFALAELRLTLRQLDNDLESLRERNRELEGELQHARSEIDNFRGMEHELSQTMSLALRRANEIEEGASSRAREIIAQAEEAAMRIRTEASRRIEDSSAQFDELVRLKDNLVDAMRGVVRDFDQAISRVERGDQLFPGEMQPGEIALPAPPSAEPWPKPTEPAPADEAEPAPSPPPLQPQAAAPPSVSPPPAAAAPPPVSPPPPGPLRPPAEPAEPAEVVFDRRVELDAGPFSDFAALSAFERSLAHLPKVEDVYVRRLTEDRALIELTLSEPAPLLQTMKESLPYQLDVRSANRSKLVVNVAAQTTAATR
jgi:DivIVA protein